MRLEIEKLAKQFNVELATYKFREALTPFPKHRRIHCRRLVSDDELIRLRQMTPHGVFIDSTPDPNHFDSVRPDLKQMTRKR
ncbi:hypothetical protein PO124_02295 [Bacillus licheniformis]|nr:hypothetical protein [Bacillus licheniformis]